MALKYAIDAASVTPVLTSCGRFDLLDQTIQSFLEHFETDRIIVSDDSTNLSEAGAFASSCPVVEMRSHQEKLGQMRSIDALYASVRTPYVLHLEDDWFFTRGVALDSVVDLLEARTDISVVCIGYRFDKRFAHKVHKVTHSGTEFLLWDVDTHPKWFSFSLNPSVGRVALWRQIGPFAKFQTEENISAFCKGRGMRIAMVNPSCAYHIGEKRHAHDPFQPRRATTLLSRLRRSAAKRWPLAAGERSTWR
jgi:hypothetical protein